MSEYKMKRKICIQCGVIWFTCQERETRCGLCTYHKPKLSELAKVKFK